MARKQSSARRNPPEKQPSGRPPNRLEWLAGLLAQLNAVRTWDSLRRTLSREEFESRVYRDGPFRTILTLRVLCNEPGGFQAELRGPYEKAQAYEIDLGLRLLSDELGVWKAMCESPTPPNEEQAQWLEDVLFRLAHLDTYVRNAARANQAQLHLDLRSGESPETRKAKRPLSPAAGVVLQVILACEADRGLTAREIVVKAKDLHRTTLIEQTVRGWVMKQLRPLGVANLPGKGYVLPKRRRAAATKALRGHVVDT
jgi:hypothetical protein